MHYGIPSSEMFPCATTFHGGTSFETNPWGTIPQQTMHYGTTPTQPTSYQMVPFYENVSHECSDRYRVPITNERDFSDSIYGNGFEYPPQGRGAMYGDESLLEITDVVEKEIESGPSTPLSIQPGPRHNSSDADPMEIDPANPPTPMTSDWLTQCHMDTVDDVYGRLPNVCEIEHKKKDEKPEARDSDDAGNAGDASKCASNAGPLIQRIVLDWTAPKYPFTPDVQTMNKNKSSPNKFLRHLASSPKRGIENPYVSILRITDESSVKVNIKTGWGEVLDHIIS